MGINVTGGGNGGGGSSFVADRMSIAFNGIDNLTGANYMRFAVSSAHVKQSTNMTIDFSNTNNNFISVVKDGWYDIDCVAGVDTNTVSDGSASLTLRINGISQSEKSITKLYRTASGSDCSDKFVIKASYFLSAGDVIQFFYSSTVAFNITDRAIRIVEFNAA